MGQRADADIGARQHQDRTPTSAADLYAAEESG